MKKGGVIFVLLYQLTINLDSGKACLVLLQSGSESHQRRDSSTAGLERAQFLHLQMGSCTLAAWGAEMRPTVLFYVWLRGWPIHTAGRASWLHVTVVVATRRDVLFKEGRGRDRGQDEAGMLIVLPRTRILLAANRQ